MSGVIDAVFPPEEYTVGVQLIALFGFLFALALSCGGLVGIWWLIKQHWARAQRRQPNKTAPRQKVEVPKGLDLPPSYEEAVMASKREAIVASKREAVITF